MEQRQPPPDAPLVTVVVPAMKVGAVCGGAGFILGGASGIVRGLPAFLSAGLSAIQTFSLGSTFSLCRTGIISAWTIDGRSPEPRHLTVASAIAGGMSGGSAGLVFRGRSNVIPGAVMMTIFGAAGQHFYNRYAAPQPLEPQEPQDNFWKRMGKKSWTPFKVLSKEEYSEMLQERMLKLETEVAVLDDQIAVLKEQQQSERANEQATE